MSTLKADTIQSTSGGAATLTKQYAAKAWVNGDTDASILDSNNISSSSDIGTGRYQYNFTNSMVNTFYAASGTSEGGANMFSLHQGVKAASSCQTRNVTHADVDNDIKHGMVIHGDLA
jgi:hypothetical protein